MISFHTIARHAQKAKVGHNHFWHVAFLTKGGAIVAIGYNHDNIHAEAHALSQVWPDHRPGLVLWSYRLAKGGRLAMAKPCEDCQSLMRSDGVLRVRYSDSEGKIQNLKL